jgi:hypothetical protein
LYNLLLLLCPGRMLWCMCGCSEAAAAAAAGKAADAALFSTLLLLLLLPALQLVDLSTPACL